MGVGSSVCLSVRVCVYIILMFVKYLSNWLAFI